MTKELRGKVDLTPSWRAVLPIYLDALEHGSDANKQLAREELTRMAGLADAYVKSQTPEVLTADQLETTNVRR